jgi:hypothetical protein
LQNVSQFARTAGAEISNRLFGKLIEPARLGVPLDRRIEPRRLEFLEPGAEPRELIDGQFDAAERVGRLFGLSDRVRYYWPEPRVDAAVKTLTRNIDAAPVPPGLISQFVGAMLPEGEAPLSRRIVEAKVGAVVAQYRRTTGASRG